MNGEAVENEEKKRDPEAERMARAAQRAIQVERCRNCHWGRLDSGILFCPFPQGVCMKGRIV